MVSSVASNHVPSANQAAVAASVILTRYRTRLRRQMNDRDVVRSCTLRTLRQI